jgi:hypothetical protein
MMWNGQGWGPMYGWWMMPFGMIFMVIFIVICLLIVSRFFRGGGFCGGPMRHDSDIDGLKKEIQSLREEIKELKNK